MLLKYKANQEEIIIAQIKSKIKIQFQTIIILTMSKTLCNRIIITKIILMKIFWADWKNYSNKEIKMMIKVMMHPLREVALCLDLNRTFTCRIHYTLITTWSSSQTLTSWKNTRITLFTTTLLRYWKNSKENKN